MSLWVTGLACPSQGMETFVACAPTRMALAPFSQPDHETNMVNGL